MTDYLFGLLCGYSLAMITTSYVRRRGSNPPPPGRKPAPPVGPPEQPLAADLIRYWHWKNEQVCCAWEPTAAKPPTKPEFPPPRLIREDFLPTTPKPPIKPQPPGGHLIQEGRLWGGYQPRPQGGTFPSVKPFAP